MNGGSMNGTSGKHGEIDKHDSVKEYYGKILEKSSDLKTTACCTSEAPSKALKKVFKLLHEEVLSKYYGCGLVIPEQLDGLSILDLGCGAGRDVYILSKLVGENGRVVGIDMTDEQIDVAKKHIPFHTKSFGFSKPNVEFRKGYIENLEGLADDSFDIVVSNCVVNLSPDKESVLSEVFRVLKPGGEMYFSDVYASQRIPKHLVENPVLFGECLSGALYWNDFLYLAKKCGFRDPRLVKDAKIGIDNDEIEELVGHISFFSATYRLFKLDGLEGDCENYGQAVIYKGTMEGLPHCFCLDGHHEIYTGAVFPVCGNTWRMLHDTRFKPHFTFIGNFDKHYGIYPGCGKDIPYASANDGTEGAACC